MEQLLEVKIVPIAFEMKVHNAKIEEISSSSLRQGIVDYRDLLPYTNRLRVDTHEIRNKAVLKAVSPISRSSAELYAFPGMSTTADLAKEGKLLMNAPEFSPTLGSLALQHYQPTMQTAVGIPPANQYFNMDTQQLSAQYESQKQNFDWLSENKPRLIFIPASVEFLVKEYAHVEFKYLGKPQYVPPSASPDYKKPQLDTIA